MDVTAALQEAADELLKTRNEAKAEQRLWALLRLHLHFARQAASVPSVLAAQGPVWAMNALQSFPPGHRTHEPALALLTALAAHPAARETLCGPTPPAWPAGAAGAQRMSTALAAARRAARAGCGDDTVSVAHVHCGGAKAASPKRLASLNVDAALCAELARRCAADAAGAAAPATPDVEVRAVPTSDPRQGLAGVGRAVHARVPLPVRTVVGPYAGWVTTPDDFDALVALRERSDYEAYAVTTEMHVRCCSDEDADVTQQPLMFVAWPPAVANATAQLNDWRAAPWERGSGAKGGADADADSAGGPNCELLEVLHRGWPHVFVVTSRAIAAGEELTVQYPRAFWKGRARALEAYAAAGAAIEAGLAAAVTAAAGDGDADAAAQRKGKKARRCEAA